MMRRVLFAALLFFSASAFAQTGLYCGSRGPYTVPTGEQLYCSQNVSIQGGTCNGTDQVMNLIASSSGTWQIKPWDNQPIMLRGIEVSIIGGMGPLIWAQVGNGNVPDIMLNLGSGQTHGRHDFPPGTGMPVPASSAAGASDYFDLHIACSGGGSINAFITFYYTPNGPITPYSTVYWNPADVSPQIALYNTNLSAHPSIGNSGFFGVRANLARSTGKYQWEAVIGQNSSSATIPGFGTAAMLLSSYVGNSAVSVGLQSQNGGFSTTGGGFNCLPTGVIWAANETMDWAIDLDAGKIWIAHSGTWVNSGNPATGTNPTCTFTAPLTLYPAWSAADPNNNVTARFSAGSFSTPIPAGFNSWQ